MRKRYRALALALAGVLVLASMPVRAEGYTAYAGGNGSWENSGMTAESPLDSIYEAQKLLPEGGTILVTGTIYITGESSYSLNDGITLQAAEELDGPIFAVEEGGSLTLNNIVIIGNGSTVISNRGILKLDDSVSLQVKGGEGVGCVYTGEGGATYLNEELVAGDAVQDGEPGTEESETGNEVQDETGESGGKDEETAQTEEAVSTETGETAVPDETEKVTSSDKETDETENTEEDNNTETEKNPEGTEKDTEESGETNATEGETAETDETSATEVKPEETEKLPEADKKPDTVPETEKKPEETKQPETAQTEKNDGASGVEQGIKEEKEPVRRKAVETVTDAIIALNIHSREDVGSLLPVSQAYDGLTAAEKQAVPNHVRQLLESAKEMAAAYNHTQLGVSVYGNLPWYVQFRVKLTDVGKKEENGLKVLVPYELTLWNLYTDSVYTLPEGETVTVTMPVPDVEIDGEFTVFHYKADGSVETIKPVIHGNMMSFETSSFSPFSVAGSTLIAGIGIGSGTPGNSGNNSTSNGSSPAGNAPSKNDAPSTNSSTEKTYNSPGGNYVAAAANTSDTTNAFPAAAAGAVALFVIIGITVRKRRWLD